MTTENDMKATYEAQGFVTVENLFSHKKIVSIRQNIESLLKNIDSRPEGVVISHEGSTLADKNRSAANNHSIRGAAFLVRFIPFFQDIARDEKLLRYVRKVLGKHIRVFRDQALFKPPNGQKKPIHQDQSYFLIDPPDELLTAWIPLDDATIENGCMHYIPQSHRFGLFPVENDSERPVHHVPNTSTAKLASPIACPIKPGSVIFHHGCTLHYSEANQSKQWRRAIIFHYTTKRASSANDKLNNEISLELE